MNPLVFTPIPILAEASPNEIGTWILCAGVIAQLVLTIVTLVSMNAKQKREISFVGTPVDQKDFLRHVEENKADRDNLFSKIGGVERGVEQRLTVKLEHFEQDSKNSRRDMHTEITNLTKEVAGLQTSSDLTNQRIVQIDGKLDRLIERGNE